MLTTVLTAVFLVLAVQSRPDYVFKTSVSEESMHKCHTGYRDFSARCHEYTTKNIDKSQYPEIPANCTTIEWKYANETNNWGNCVKITTDDEYLYVTANNVPDFYMNLYCPIGVGFGYCSHAEIDSGTCMFPNLTCGADNGPGSMEYGDVWIPLEANYKIPLKGNPTRNDRPGDMYDAETVGGEKTIGPSTGVAINGIGIQGPNDAGDVSIDEANIQLSCGGHVTPPLGNIPPGPGPPGPAGPPMYHFHKSPECLEPFKNASIGVEHGAQPYVHAQLLGWAMDGFKIFAYQDVGGATPIVDECGGHFGPTDTGDIEYHYHSRQIVPYHLACQGPSLSNCAETQRGTSYCHPGCGADVCVQPGTSEADLREYLAQWDPTWLDKYTTNNYKKTSHESKAQQHKVPKMKYAIKTLLEDIFDELQ